MKISLTEIGPKINVSDKTVKIPKKTIFETFRIEKRFESAKIGKKYSGRSGNPKHIYFLFWP